MATIVTRAGKGSALTFAEGDANFTNLNNDKIEAVSDDTSPQLSGNLDLNGNQITTSVVDGDIIISPNGITDVQSDLKITNNLTITDTEAAGFGTILGGANTGVAIGANQGNSETLFVNYNGGITLSSNTYGVEIDGQTFPTADGSAGQVIVTNGAGTLSWADRSIVADKTSTFVYGKCAEAISKGDVVMFGGVQGDHILLKQADASATGFITQWIIGLAETAGALNDFIYVRTLGQLVGIDTATDFAVGDLLWFDPSVAGGLTATEPSAPNPKVLMAAVTKENLTDGIVLVRPTLSFKLTDIEDVETASAATNDFLVYDGSKWAHTPLDISYDSTPQLGGNLDVQNYSITTSTVNGNITLVPNGTGTTDVQSDLNVENQVTISDTEASGYGVLTADTSKSLFLSTNGGDDTQPYIIVEYTDKVYISGGLDIDGMVFPASDGTSGQVLTTNGTGTLSWTTVSGGGGISLTDLSVTVGSPGTANLSYNNTTGVFTYTPPDLTGFGTLSNVVEDTTPQLGGNLDGQGNKVENVELDDYKETIYTAGTTTGTITPDVANGNVQSITLTGNITFNAFANAETGQSMTIIIKQPASGGPYTLTSTMKFAGGTKTLSTAANAIDIMTVFYDGTTYYASLATNFS